MAVNPPTTPTTKEKLVSLWKERFGDELADMKATPDIASKRLIDPKNSDLYVMFRDAVREELKKPESNQLTNGLTLLFPEG